MARIVTDWIPASAGMTVEVGVLTVEVGVLTVGVGVLTVGVGVLTVGVGVPMVVGGSDGGWRE